MPTSLTQQQTHNVRLAYRPDIDGLRAVAILAVLVFHAFPDHLPGGFIGVDIFFVISGFLISSIIFRSLQRDDFSFTEFYAHRIKRIFPALIVVLLACYAAGWFVLLPEEFKQLGKHIAAGSGFIQNIVLWSEAGYFDTASELKPLTHLWSLAIEEQFYLIFPLLIWGVWRLGFKVAGIFVLGLVLATMSFGSNLLGIQADPVGTFFLPHTRFWELLAGSLLAYVQVFKSNRFVAWLGQGAAPAAVGPTKRQHLLSICGFLLVAIGLLTIHEGRLFPGWWALLPVAGAFLLLLAGPHAWINRRILGNRFMVFIGLISYPLYLWHWPILSFARIVSLETPPILVRLGALLLSVLLSWLTYRLLERPLRFGRAARGKTAALCIILAGVGYAGYHAYLHDGLPLRLPSEARELLVYQYDYKNGYQEGTCFLRPEQDQRAFDNCADTAGTDKRIMLLWGDSHAAHLYPGVQAKYGGSWTIRQRTASGCPPIPGMDIADRIHCKGINTSVLDEIKTEVPEIVVLAAAWSEYDWNRLGNTVQALRLYGVSRIVMVGPVPQWQDGLPKQLLQEFRSNPLEKVLPKRMPSALNKSLFELDRKLAAFASSAGVTYISALGILCDDNGCLTRVGDEPGELTAWDYGHLTAAASQYLVSRFPKELGIHVNATPPALARNTPG
ncbi:acyltransferase [Alcaligenaceae bacterium]|nr:acyltransferase [Alcaligenaceae bacterium]